MAKLLQWDASREPNVLAREVMTEILAFLDVFVANEENAADVLGIYAGQTDIHAGKLDIDKYPLGAREIVGQFPNMGKVAITLRESISASHKRYVH